MGRPKHGEKSREHQAADLAARPGGITAVELAAELALDIVTARSTLYHAGRRFGLVHVRATGVGGGMPRWFATERQARQWLHRALAKLQARLRAVARLKAQRAAQAPAPAARRQRGAGKATVTVKAMPAMPAMPAAPATPTLPRRPPAKAAPAAPEVIVPPDVKHTVWQHRPEPHRIDLFAAPTPGVPGWGGGPVIRDGALDFKRHQTRR